MPKNCITQCQKTEMVIFKSMQKKFEDLKIKCRKRHPTESVKYLSRKIDTNLSLHYVNGLSIKMNKMK